MLAAVFDPLEGAVVALVGCGLVALGTFLGNSERSLLVYWICIFSLMAVGVGAMVALSAGGRNRRHDWALDVVGVFASALPYRLDYGLGQPLGKTGQEVPTSSRRFATTRVAQASAFEVCGFSDFVHPIIGSPDRPMSKENTFGSHS